MNGADWIVKAAPRDAMLYRNAVHEGFIIDLLQAIGEMVERNGGASEAAVGAMFSATWRALMCPIGYERPAAWPAREMIALLRIMAQGDLDGPRRDDRGACGRDTW